jgi:hypothetical protein
MKLARLTSHTQSLTRAQQQAMHKSHLEVLASFSAKGSHRLGRNGDVVCTLQTKINYPTTLAASTLIRLLSEMLKISAPKIK